MKVIIAEKPSVAREIAAIVGAKSRKDGYLEGNGYAVSWAIGHLVGLVLPEEYGITGFKAENLPILPNPFMLKPRQIKDGKAYKTDPGAKKQLNTIKELFDGAEGIIVATDAGREGELIFRYIYSYLQCNKPFDRLWISSLTDKAIREGLKNLRPGKEYDNLYQSAKARSEADWLVGINASQALSIAAGSGVWSLGRVQTPTLAIICSRYLENKSFQPKTYYQISVQSEKGNKIFTSVAPEKHFDKSVADEVFSLVNTTQSLCVKKVERKEANQEPPLLYDLTSLQKEANSKHAFSAGKTLTIAQTLYESKYITYPRTGSRYISADVMDEIPELIKGLSEHPRFGAYALTMAGKPLNKRSVDDKKVTDHHAMIVTDHIPKSLSEDECIIYEMIAGRMLEAFSEKCKKENTQIILDTAGQEFLVKGSIILAAGWRGVFGEQEKDDEEEMAILPELAEGDILPVKGFKLQEKQTKPKPIHTESSLLAAMEGAGKELENEEEREALKESGIGTPATRAAIIETLFSRAYIRREKKSLVPTEKGLSVYEVVKDKKIADAAMTGSWELALSKVAEGKMDALSFHQGIEVYASQITTELLTAKIDIKDSRPGSPCPRCSGQVIFYPKVAKCLNTECNLLVFRNIASKELTDTHLNDLLMRGKTSLIKNFRSKSGKTFDAAIAFDEQYNTIFAFEPRKSGKKNVGK